MNILKDLKIFVIILYISGCNKPHVNTEIKMYDNIYITMYIEDKFEINSIIFGSDCNECYPSKLDKFIILDKLSDTLGRIEINYDLPFSDSIVVKNKSFENFQEIEKNHKMIYLNKIFNDNKLILTKITTFERNKDNLILLEFDGMNAILYQFHERQIVSYNFINF